MRLIKRHEYPVCPFCGMRHPPHASTNIDVVEAAVFTNSMFSAKRHLPKEPA